MCGDLAVAPIVSRGRALGALRGFKALKALKAVGAVRGASISDAPVFRNAIAIQKRGKKDQVATEGQRGDGGGGRLAETLVGKDHAAACAKGGASIRPGTERTVFGRKVPGNLRADLPNGDSKKFKVVPLVHRGATAAVGISGIIVGIVGITILA